jgi:hypothetical protein
MVSFMFRLLCSLKWWEALITMGKNKKHGYYFEHCPSVDNVQSHSRVYFNTTSSEIFSLSTGRTFVSHYVHCEEFLSGKSKGYFDKHSDLINVGER